ncbi:(deoxy)nucleoside triphosphate pyrophosphohydrolase [Sphingobacterium paludis]|uniref:8-oxo-dGTP diphosphatase n=1 Tax=Sphingobacterium paludis TaxID=1476465 RepID=A0A4R7CXE1_9SPHI|nr:(deoxy)nucleoside triphosphate pyrophosphohydrolase [Sphingobacterium paludis]TDS12371.1 8-oxo-dGTP diphosphatase [Sphingobacterium paludis]
MLEVTCALIEHQGKILICQRAATMKLPLKWEFPGGKREVGETLSACLVREIKEELGLDIVLGRELPAVQHRYDDFSITLFPFLATRTGGTLTLAEHVQALWVDPSSLQGYDWAAADVPVVNAYLALRQ